MSRKVKITFDKNVQDNRNISYDIIMHKTDKGLVMTILELKKMMMKAKKEDKTKANALMMLVDSAQKIAKANGEEVGEKHIQEAAKKLAKMAKESIEAGMKDVEKELEIYESFLPKMLSEEETAKIIKDIIDEIGGKNMGEIMKRLKARGDIDMAMASRIIKSL
jgi:hypothetical protein